MKYEIAICVDTNDADFQTEVSEIDSDQLQMIKPLIQAIKNFQSYEVPHSDHLGAYTWRHDHNYPTQDCLREDLGEIPPQVLYDFPEEVHELFRELCPWPEHGFHTIESITITPAVKKIELL